jgi:hypothetical protein
LPSVGDQTEIHISYVKPGNVRHAVDPSYIKKDFANATLLVRCVKATRDHCIIEVRYRNDGEDNPPVYFVHLNYTSSNLVSNVTIIDTKGHVIPRGKSIRGVPSPFFAFASLPGDYELIRKKDGTWHSRMLHSGSDHDYKERRTVEIRDEISNGASHYDIFQHWKPGDWLWDYISKTDGTSQDPPFTASR